MKANAMNAKMVNAKVVNEHKTNPRRTRVTRRAGTNANDQACTKTCDSCGLAKDKMQCDGSGRIQGGLAAIEVFSWWPIKAYRPCPGLITSGGVYTRAGQDVNSILWGENGGDAPTSRKK